MADIIVTVTIDGDYKEYLEESFNSTIEDIIEDYISAEAEGMIDAEYKNKQDKVSIKDKLNDIKNK